MCREHDEILRKADEQLARGQQALDSARKKTVGVPVQAMTPEEARRRVLEESGPLPLAPQRKRTGLFSSMLGLG